MVPSGLLEGMWWGEELEGSSLAPAPELLLPLVGGEREVGEQAGVGAEMGSCGGGASGTREVKPEQAFRDNISHLPCLHLRLECREVAPLLPAPEEEGEGEETSIPLGLGSSEWVLRVRALGETLQSPPGAQST